MELSETWTLETVRDEAGGYATASAIGAVCVVVCWSLIDEPSRQLSAHFPPTAPSSYRTVQL
jgi:hypothetical protein